MDITTERVRMSTLEQEIRTEGYLNNLTDDEINTLWKTVDETVQAAVEYSRLARKQSL